MDTPWSWFRDPTSWTWWPIHPIYRCYLPAFAPMPRPPRIVPPPLTGCWYRAGQNFSGQLGSYPITMGRISQFFAMPEAEESVPEGRLEVVKSNLRLLEIKGYCQPHSATCDNKCTDSSIRVHSHNANECTTAVVTDFDHGRYYKFELCDMNDDVVDTITLRTKELPPEVSLKLQKATGRTLEIRWEDCWKEEAFEYEIRYRKNWSRDPRQIVRTEQLCTIAIIKDLEQNTEYLVGVYTKFREKWLAVGKITTFKTKDSWELREHVIKAKLRQLWSQIYYQEKTQLWNRFSNFFEFALIWDTLISPNEEHKPIFISEGTDYGQINKAYLISWKDDEMHIKSIPCPGNLPDGSVAVTYVSKIYGHKTFYKTFDSFDMDKSLEGFSVNEVKFHPVNQQFRSPKLECPSEIQHLIEERIRQEAKKYQPEPEVEAKIEKLKKEGQISIQKVKKEKNTFALMLQQNFWEDKPSVEGLIKKIVQQISDMQGNSCLTGLKLYAEFYFAYKCITEGYEPFKEHWELFLNGAREYYDKLLFRHRSGYPRPAEHQNGEDDCKICERQGDYFFDYRKSELYHLVDNDLPKQDKKFCCITNIIYLIVCSNKQCRKRYVGKTEKSLKLRYPNGTKAEDKDHFKLSGHEEIFHILQVVDEKSLIMRQFGITKSLPDFLRTSKLDLEGIEHIWINRLIDRTEDLNTKLNFSYREKHRRRMEGLLRIFAEEQPSVASSTSQLFG